MSQGPRKPGGPRDTQGTRLSIFSTKQTPFQAALSLPVDGWGRGEVEPRWPWHPNSCLCGWPVAPASSSGGKRQTCEAPEGPWKWQRSIKVGWMKAWLSSSFSFKSFLEKETLSWILHLSNPQVHWLYSFPLRFSHPGGTRSPRRSSVAPAWERRGLYHSVSLSISFSNSSRIPVWGFSQTILKPVWIFSPYISGFSRKTEPVGCLYIDRDLF